MLTPIEIQGKTFKNSGMGYSKADVDSFLSSVSADFEAQAALRIIPSCFSMGEGIARYIARLEN